jgi:hypothetical protein
LLLQAFRKIGACGAMGGVNQENTKWVPLLVLIFGTDHQEKNRN